jgi:sialidase-1
MLSGRGTINRRNMLKTTASFAGTAWWMGSKHAFASASFEIESITTISFQPQHYHGWPTVARTANGEILVVCSGGRESHVCPFGRVELIRSQDEGETWSFPRVLLDGPIDDRDAGLLVTSQGTILVTTFTSLAYEEYKLKSKAASLSAEQRKRWLGVHQRISAEQRQQELGCWMVRSIDGGVTWSSRYDSLVNSPHGPIQLSSGQLLYPGVALWKKDRAVGVCESADDGASWSWLAGIEPRPGDDLENYHELHGVEAADGRIIVQIRNHNKTNQRETLQCESTDGGRTWSKPHAIGVWGLPSHLLRLKDGRLLMTYGHRRKPLGNQARVSDDNGKTWSKPMIFQGDAISGDLGYPSTVQLDDGSLLSVWYELVEGSTHAVLRQAKWRLAS